MLSEYPIHTAIPVKDMHRARDWYGEKLGFTPADDAPMPQGDEAVYFNAADGTKFFLYPTRGAVAEDHTIADFFVGGHLDEVMGDLRGRGVAFEEYDLPDLKTHEGVAEMPGAQGYRTAWFKDCEGNTLALVGAPA